MFIGWLTCISQVLLPHSLCRCATVNAPATRQMPIASVVMGQCKKQEDKVFAYEKSLTNCPLFDMKRLFGFDRLLTSDNFYERTIPRRLSKERFWFSRFRQWLIKTETWKLRLDNFSVFSGFLGLRAEVTLEKETPEFRKVQVRAEVKLLNFVEDDFYEFWLNSVWILFWENFYNYLLRNIFSEDWKLKIIALIYGRFDLTTICGELTLRFWQTFRILRAEIAFRQS